MWSSLSPFTAISHAHMQGCHIFPRRTLALPLTFKKGEHSDIWLFHWSAGFVPLFKVKWDFCRSSNITYECDVSCLQTDCCEGISRPQSLNWVYSGQFAITLKSVCDCLLSAQVMIFKWRTESDKTMEEDWKPLLGSAQAGEHYADQTDSLDSRQRRYNAV